MAGRPVALEEQERRLWSRLEGELEGAGSPQALVSTLTPFPFWVVVGSMLLLPVALILSFFVRRQAIVSFGDEVAVYEVSFWRQRVTGERLRVPAGAGQVALDDGKLLIAGQRFHIEPGWRESAERIVG